MKKISETEENEMYKIINQALFCLCEEKPNNPVEFLSKKMLKILGDNPESLHAKKRLITNINTKQNNQSDEMLIDAEKLNMNSKMVKFSNLYKIIRKIGQSGHSITYLAEYLEDPEIKRAVKIFEKNHFSSIILSDSNKEELLNLNAPNICKIYEILEDQENFYIVQEYCNGGDIFEFFINYKSLSEITIRKIIKEILLGVYYIHSKEIIIKNIKPENILIVKDNNDQSMNNFTVKITDSGFKNIFIEKNRKEEDIDSVLYMAPENFQNKYYKNSDIYSIGIVIVTLLIGKLPYNFNSSNPGAKIIEVNKQIKIDIKFSKYKQFIK